MDERGVVHRGLSSTEYTMFVQLVYLWYGDWATWNRTSRREHKRFFEMCFGSTVRAG